MLHLILFLYVHLICREDKFRKLSAFSRIFLAGYEWHTTALQEEHSHPHTVDRGPCWHTKVKLLDVRQHCGMVCRNMLYFTFLKSS